MRRRACRVMVLERSTRSGDGKMTMELLLIVAALIRLLRSPIAPAISAGLLQGDRPVPRIAPEEEMSTPPTTSTSIDACPFAG
jgi:hypothetical protein